MPPGRWHNEEWTERYEDQHIAYRDLMISGRATAHDLAMAVVCAFGLETIDTAANDYQRVAKKTK